VCVANLIGTLRLVGRETNTPVEQPLNVVEKCLQVRILLYAAVRIVDLGMPALYVDSGCLQSRVVNATAGD